MTDATGKRRFVSITARPTPDEKHRFASLAASRDMSESQLALLAIHAVLDSNPMARGTPTHEGRVTATQRITVRLRPGDGQAIAVRAARRGMKPSAYLAALVRAHLATHPPLPTDELQALKEAIAELAAVNGVLRQIIQSAQATGELPNNLRQELGRERVAVAVLEKRLHDFVQKALISWETNYE